MKHISGFSIPVSLEYNSLAQEIVFFFLNPRTSQASSSRRQTHQSKSRFIFILNDQLQKCSYLFREMRAELQAAAAVTPPHWLERKCPELKIWQYDGPVLRNIFLQ